MNPSACPSFHAERFSRRHLLRVGGLGMLGLTLPKLLQAQDRGPDGKDAAATRPRPKARAKSVVFLYQFGGPSHVDMFDMKPDAPEKYRSPHRPIATRADGIQISERLPDLAPVMNKVTLVRTMTHRMLNHNSASYYALTGHAPPVDDIRLRDSLDLAPAYGSVVDALAPVSGELPTFVAYPHVCRDGSVTPGQHASFLGKEHDPLLVLKDPNAPDFALPELSLPNGVSFERLTARREMQRLIDRQARLLDHSAAARGLDAYYDRALAMLQSDRLRSAFDLSREPAALRDRYGRTTYGQGLLLARRLVETGVRYVTVYFSDNIGGQSTDSGGWDTHGFNNTHMFPIIEKYHLPITNQTLPVFLNDLDERGLLDETLVVWMGEFGRTPELNKQTSRDHWPHCYTALLAGGGVKRGFVHGSSDRYGMYPAEKPVRPEDLSATVFHLLGIDPHTEILNHQQRPIPIAPGEVVEDILI